MNGYIDTQRIVVRQIQAERRGDAAAERLAADGRRAEAARRGAGERGRWLRRLGARHGAPTPAAGA